MDREDSFVAGWYGKIPSAGDFISRRLPANFISTWDSWLQQAMATSCAQLQDRWLDLYLTSPIWRFILMPGTCDNSMWAGILMPSIDKVGRHFPLTIAMQIEPCPRMMLTVFSAQTWYASLEQIALAALNVNVLPDVLDQGLSKHPFPISDDQSILAQELAIWWQKKSYIGSIDHKTLSLPTASALTELFDAVAKNIFINAGLGKSIWWNVPLETGMTRLHCFTGLPPANNFATLLSNTES